MVDGEFITTSKTECIFIFGDGSVCKGLERDDYGVL